jgi:hypothetical protein
MSTMIEAGTPATTTVPVGTSTGTPVEAAPRQQPATLPTAPLAGAAPTAAPAVPARPPRKTVTLSESELRDRIARAKRQAITDTFGSDDAEALKAKLDRADQLEREAEERKRAQMSETERMKHDLIRARREAQDARISARRLQERHMVREQQATVEQLAGRHVSQSYVSMATLALREHLRGLPPKEVDRLTDKDLSKWFQRFVTKRPEIAASAQARRRAPVGSQRPVPRPTASQTSTSATSGAKKSFSPSAANSMTRSEARAAAKSRGYSW